jgi:hypothetical protein
MGSNSFQMKGWMMAIVSALLAIYSSTSNKTFLLVAVFPAFFFWGLDTYYLQQERKFRGIYNDVAGLSKQPKEVRLFEMPIQNYTEDKYSFWNVFFSNTLLLLYLPVISLLVLIYFVLQQWGGWRPPDVRVELRA